MRCRRRLAAVEAAVAALAVHPDPASLSDGLSTPMARRCLSLACGALDRRSLERATRVPGLPPHRAAVVAARGVFTAPLEWVALLATVGAEVLLKVPAAAPTFGEAVANAFQRCGLPVETTVDRTLPEVEALVAMGGDATMAALAARHHSARLLLHGHRYSVAVVHGAGLDLARALAEDALLYDGRGCFTPVAVLHVGSPADAALLAERLGGALAALREELPVGTVDPLHGPRWRSRLGLARVIGRPHGRVGCASALLPPSAFEADVLPGFFPVHPIADLAAAAALLAPWRARLAACATDLAERDVQAGLGCERTCAPGFLQRPGLPRAHGGREMLRPLMVHPATGDPARVAMNILRLLDQRR